MTTDIKPLDNKPRPLPVNVYETIHFMALVNGGLGAGNSRDDMKPACVYEVTTVLGSTPESNSMQSALHTAGIDKNDNDAAVRHVNMQRGVYGVKYYGSGEELDGEWWTPISERKGTGKQTKDCFWHGCVDRSNGSNRKISFEDWCLALNVYPVEDGSEDYGAAYGEG